MFSIKDKILGIVRLLNLIREENNQWKKDNTELLNENKTKRAIADQVLAAELKKRKLQLEHEIALLKTKQASRFAMYKTRCKQDIKDYKQYLASLDQLKQSIQSSYIHLPESVAFTIHHHAKYLLHKMWETEDFEQKLQMEMKLIQFMATVQEDARSPSTEKSISALPEKALSLLENP